MSKIFKSELMQVRSDIKDWKSVIKEGVNILCQHGYANEKLANDIFEATKKYGAYYVLEPGIALLHAPPGDYAYKPGMSFILLNKNIQFNNEEKYARFIFTLSANDSKSNMDIIEEFGKVFASKENKAAILKSTTINEIEVVMKKLNL